jgi:hypothetical protein
VREAGSCRGGYDGAGDVGKWGAEEVGLRPLSRIPPDEFFSSNQMQGAVRRQINLAELTAILKWGVS